MRLTEGLGELHPDVLVFHHPECFSTFTNVFSCFSLGALLERVSKSSPRP